MVTRCDSLAMSSFYWDDQRDEVVLLGIFRWYEVAGDRVNGEAAAMAASGVQEIEGGKEV